MDAHAAAAGETARPRILLLTEYSPFTSHSFGGQQRTLLLWNALRELGDVDLLLMEAADDGPCEVPAPDPRIALSVKFRQGPGGVLKFVRDRALSRLVDARLSMPSYQLVCSRYLGPGAKLHFPTGVPVLVDLDDAGYTYASAESAVRTMLLQAKSLLRRRLERRVLRRFDRFWFVSARDRERFREVEGGVLPNVPVAIPDAPPEPAHSAMLLFVGALWYGPNVEGVRRFLALIWPRIKKVRPDATLVLAGGASPEVRAGWSSVQGVTAPGFVPDLAALYQQAAFTIVPIYSGGGTNIKVLESLAYQRTCVTTAFVSDAFAPLLRDGEHFAVASDDASFADACIRLLDDAPRREQLAARGRATVQADFSVERFNAAVAREVRLALADRQ